MARNTATTPYASGWFFFFSCCYLSLFSSARMTTIADDIVFYPVQRDQDELATKINCRVDESRHFKYNSVTELWSEIEGQIMLEADINLRCLGDDKEGIYGAQALKYVAEISNLVIEENHKSDDVTVRRRKRGIGDFFSNTWQKIKNFFTRLFGGSSSEEEEHPNPPPEIDDRSVTVQTTATSTHAPTTESEEEEEEEEEDFKSYRYKDLYTSPFEFIQLANGSIPEIRFAANDTDSKVRNFKRHLVDAFATQLSLKPQHEVVVEMSVMGEHLSTYNITLGPTSSAYSDSEGDDQEDEYPTTEDDERMIVVEKVVTEDDILILAPGSESGVINNKDKMGLMARQTQIFKGGKLISTSGSSSLVLFPKEEDKLNRRKRNAEESGDEGNVMSYFQAHSRYQIQFMNRRKRSLDDNYLQQRTYGTSSYSAASRTAESEGNSARQQLRELHLSIGNTKELIEHLVKNIGEYEYEKLQPIFEMVEQEVRYDLDEEPQSLALQIRRVVTEQVTNDLCRKNFRKCIDLLQLLARSGGPEAEQVLSSFISNDKYSLRERQEIVDLLSDLPNPSSKIIQDLNTLLKGNSLEPSLLGSISLSASNMAAKASEELRLLLAKTFSEILESRSPSQGVATDSLTVDVLEAIGNIGHESSVGQVLQISSASPSRIDVQIACAHALRHMAALPSVQQWFLRMITSGPCDVSHAIVGSLLDEIYKQEMAGDENSWPRVGYNDVDIVLRDKLSSSAPEFECSAADAARYFERKKSSSRDEKSAFFEADSEPFEPATHSRQKRDLWDKLKCGEWMEDDKYTPIQEKEEFASDRATYNKRKSCLATRKLGLAGAKADIYAGMFAGIKEPSDPPKYKLFTKFVSGISFLGHDMEIGSFYFYHHSGYTKAYVRILGKTRQEFRHDGCTPTELRYRPITHIPLYLVSIAVLQFSLGIHISSELALNTLCPSTDAYDMKPLSKVRVGGEAMGTVLFARAAINLGGNFNYHLRFTFSPVPDMCLTGQHGYDPMSVSLEAYYQLWNVGKVSWGKPRNWKPASLMWEVKDGKQQMWFNDTCILKAEPVTEIAVTSTKPSETDTDTDTLTVPPGEENDILVVRA